MPGFSNQQMELLPQQRQIENPEVRARLMTAIRTLIENRDAVKATNAAMREYDKIIGEEDVPAAGVDILLEEGLAVRLRPKQTAARKATKAGTGVDKTIFRTEGPLFDK